MEEEGGLKEATSPSGEGGGAPRKPTAKAVNKRDGEARYAPNGSDARAAARYKLLGVWREIGRQAVKRKGLRQQVDFLFARARVRSVHGKDRDVSAPTRDKKHRTVARFCEDLSRLPEGRGVSSMDQIRRVHALAVFKYWIARGLSASTVSNRISDMRDWFVRMGKPDTITSGHEWEMTMRNAGIDTRKLRRSTVATEAKDWLSKGIDAQALIEKVWVYSKVVGAQLLMQLFFGARVREGYSCNPFLDARGNIMVFDKGTKGGRPRTVELDSNPAIRAVQLEVIERVKAVAAEHPKRYLARKGDSAVATRNHFYYVCKKFGITKRDLGVTAHGLRHQYLQQRYTGLTGLPAPVHNAAPARLYRELGEGEKAARQLTSEEAGHWRPDISSAYISSIKNVEQRQQRNQAAVLELLEKRADVDQTFRAFGATRVWFVGAAAEGLDLRQGDRYAIATCVQDAKHPSQVTALTKKLQEMTGKPFVLTLVSCADEVPNDSLEVTLLSEFNPSPHSGS